MRVTKKTSITKVVVELTVEEVDGIAGVLGSLHSSWTPTDTLYQELLHIGAIDRTSETYKKWKEKSERCIIY